MMRGKLILTVVAVVIVAGGMGTYFILTDPIDPPVANGSTGPIADVPPAPMPDQASSSASGKAQPAAGAVPASQPATVVQAAADRYAALLEKATRAAALVAEREQVPVAARPPIDAAPLPPLPAQPGGLPSPKALEDWSDAYDDALTKQVSQDKGQGLFQLLGTVCKGALLAAGTPEASGLCELVGPILQALGLSLGEGEDINEAAQAVLAVQNGDYGPLQKYLAKNPDVQDGIVRIMGSLERIDPKARERLLGQDLRGLTCSEIRERLNSVANGRQRDLLMASITPSELRRQVTNQCR